MAVSGSATSAYRVRLDGLTLLAIPTTTQNSMCTPPRVAVGLLVAGDTVTIAGSDMAELRRLWDARQGVER